MVESDFVRYKWLVVTLLLLLKGFPVSEILIFQILKVRISFPSILLLVLLKRKKKNFVLLNTNFFC